MFTQILGRQIAELRWLFGISTSTLSRETGISESMLCSIESGSCDTDVIELDQICSALKISLQDLIELAEFRQVEAAGSEPQPELDLSERPPLSCLADYRISSRWYKARKELSDWMYKKRDQARRKRLAQIEQMQASRLELRTLREMHIQSLKKISSNTFELAI